MIQGDRSKAIKTAIRELNSRYGPGTVQVGADETIRPIATQYAYSNIPALDAATGGIPLGRIIEIHGGEDSGKTALALHLAQWINGPVLFMDADCGLSPAYLWRWGMQELCCMHPETLEAALEVCRSAAGAFGTIVIDTLTALPTRAELSCHLDECNLGAWEAAEILSHALPALVSILRRTGCTLILVNQMRSNPHIVYGRPEYPTGGRAIGYYAAQRMAVYRTERNHVGQGIVVYVRKNKYNSPGRRAEVGLIYGCGLVPWRKWKDESDSGAQA